MARMARMAIIIAILLVLLVIFKNEVFAMAAVVAMGVMVTMATMSASSQIKYSGGASKIVNLVQLVPSHREQLKHITSQKNTMKWVGNGRTWDDERIEKFLSYSVGDGADKPNKYRYWGIEDESHRLIGVVGIHPASYDKSVDAAVTIFIDQSSIGRGVGRIALSEAIDKYWELWPDAVIYADVLETNVASLALMSKMVSDDATVKIKIRGVPYIRWKFIRKPPIRSPEKR